MKMCIKGYISVTSETLLNDKSPSLSPVSNNCQKIIEKLLNRWKTTDIKKNFTLLWNNHTVKKELWIISSAYDAT